jgi:hypothetical protein
MGRGGNWATQALAILLLIGWGVWLMFKGRPK